VVGFFLHEFVAASKFLVLPDMGVCRCCQNVNG